LFVFDILIQVATLAAVIAYFWDDLSSITIAILRGLWQKKPFDNKDARMGWLLGLATVPAGAAYLLFSDTIERAFGSPLATALFLFGTAALLLFAERIGRRDRNFEVIQWIDALVVGSFQVLALFPGISRSGATITGGMVRNLDRLSAARFSFLISFPIMVAAGFIGIVEMIKLPNTISRIPMFLPGFVTAAVVGYISIRWLLRFLNKQPLYSFAIYCAVFGIINLAFILL